MIELAGLIKIPTWEEVRALHKVDKNACDGYVAYQAYYRLLAMAMLDQRLGLSRLDSRISEYGFMPVTEERMDFYQKYECSSLKYLYLRSFVHVERLTVGEIEILKELIDNQDQQSMCKSAELVEKTWKKVLTLDIEHGERMIEEYPTLDHSGVYQGNTILLGLSSEAAYDENGKVKDNQFEDFRIKTMLAVGKQLEKICCNQLGINVGVIVNI